SITLQLISGDYRILQAYNQALNHVAFQLPANPHVGDLELLNQFADWQRRLGETCAEIHRALEDRRIEPREVRNIRRAGQIHMAAFLGFIARLEQLMEDDDDH
ncbi:MAG TPA: phage regulatory CII family protein, partial [Pseudomonadales bacterium]|nr:phage regulatory CII family protein [Pseudomonadales bacterium]